MTGMKYAASCGTLSASYEQARLQSPQSHQRHSRGSRDYYIKHRVTNDNLELRNLATVAELIINSALQRQESRGLHFTLDFPDTLAHAKDTILTPETD